MSAPYPLRSMRGMLWLLVRPYRLRVVVALMALLFAATMSLLIPLTFRRLIDGGFLGGRDLGHINLVFIQLLAVAVLLASASALRFFLVTTLGERISADLRTRIYSHLLQQRPLFFETLKVGEVLSRLTADTTLIQTVIGSSLSMALRNSLTTGGALVMLILTSPLLSGAVIGVVIVVVIPVIAFAKRVRALSRSSQDRLADSSALAQEVLTEMPTVQAFGQQDWEIARFTESCEATYRTARTRAVNRSLLVLCAIGLGFSGLVVVLWLGAQAVASGSMTPGQLTQFVMYAAFVGGGLGALSEVFGELQRATGAAERLVELLNLDTHLDGGRAPMPAAQGGVALHFENVSFSYPSRPQCKALDGIDLSVRRGETVAVVGPSGAGKSTLLALLLRWYEPAGGRILVEDQPLPTIDLDTWRHRIAYVAQDPAIFSCSVAQNIRYGRQDADAAALQAALQAAAADQFVARLPEGADTFVGERGVRLSGGEKQRLAIARAVLRDAPLLLLDEATSSLDAESERLIQLAVERSARGRTTLIVAHRLATVKAADRIVVMDRGRIVETGTHQELLALQGVYARLAELQFLDNVHPGEGIAHARLP
ncbi:MAG: ABC transporter transmembrane domain-containing protein [Burkholderiaceae bacterium]|jgi:ATP-binding cassette subfamily B protein